MPKENYLLYALGNGTKIDSLRRRIRSIRITQVIISDFLDGRNGSVTVECTVFDF